MRMNNTSKQWRILLVFLSAAQLAPSCGDNSSPYTYKAVVGVTAGQMSAFDSAWQTFQTGQTPAPVTLTLPTDTGDITVPFLPIEIRTTDFRCEGDNGTTRTPATLPLIMFFYGQPQTNDATDFARISITPGATGSEFWGRLRVNGKFYELRAPLDSIFPEEVAQLATGVAGTPISVVEFRKEDLSDGLGLLDPTNDDAVVTTSGAGSLGGTPSVAGIENLLLLRIANEIAFGAYQRSGASVVAACTRLLQEMNEVDSIHRTEVGIGIQVAYQHVWTTSQDPYDCTCPGGPPDSCRVDCPIGQFATHWNANFQSGVPPYNIAFLRHGGQPGGNRGGVATYCTPDGTPGYSMAGFQSIFADTHEVGHNLGARHPPGLFVNTTDCSTSEPERDGCAEPGRPVNMISEKQDISDRLKERYDDPNVRGCLPFVSDPSEPLRPPLVYASLGDEFDDHIVVTWAPPERSKRISGFDLYRTTNPFLGPCPGSPIATAISGTRKFIDSATSLDTGYVYSMKSIDTLGNRSACSNIALGKRLRRSMQIVTTPQSVGDDVGTEVTLTCAAAGTPKREPGRHSEAFFEFEWLRNGGVIAGEGGSVFGSPQSEYSLTLQQSDDFDEIRCRVTGEFGTVTSEPAILRIVELPEITSQPPARVAFNEGSSVTLSVTATGSSPLTYEWKKAGLSTVFSSSPDLTFGSLTALDAGRYTCTVSNPWGEATSRETTLLVNRAPFFREGDSPADQVVPVGELATFTCRPSGLFPMDVAWYRNLTLLPNTTQTIETIFSPLPSFAIEVTAGLDGDEFMCGAQNGVGFKLSEQALLTAQGSSSGTLWGDLDDDGKVRINELIKAVNVALDNAVLNADQLGRIDFGSDGSVDISDLIRAVNNALGGGQPDNQAIASFVSQVYDAPEFKITGTVMTDGNEPLPDIEIETAGLGRYVHKTGAQRTVRPNTDALGSFEVLDVLQTSRIERRTELCKQDPTTCGIVRVSLRPRSTGYTFSPSVMVLDIDVANLQPVTDIHFVGTPVN